MIGNIKDLQKHEVTHPAALNAAMKVLVSPSEGWEGYVMRVVEVEVGGFTPRHSHPWPHINYMIEGEGYVLYDNELKEVESGSFAFIPSGMEHQFQNRGNKVFKFICIVPEEGHKL